jgi:hypothetical protein
MRHTIQRRLCILTALVFESSILESNIHSNQVVGPQLPRGEIKLSTVSLCLSALAGLLLPDECRLWLASCVA